MTTEIKSNGDLSSPDQSPQHHWTMVPVLQTLTVLSDGEEMEQMEQKMGVENHINNNGNHQNNNINHNSINNNNTNSYNSLAMAAAQFEAANVLAAVAAATVNNSTNHAIINNGINNGNNNKSTATLTSSQKRKVGRPITSVKTMNRSFPAVDEIKAKLETGECYVRPRASSSSSEVWALFQEVAYRETHFFTGIVQCKTCLFLTRYHGQITGTSHMRRHHCFSLLFPNSTPANRNKAANKTAQQNGMQSQLTTVNLNVDADSTSATPRILKRLKNSLKQQITNSDYLSNYQHNLNQSMRLHQNNNMADITIHPALPKIKKFKNNEHSISMSREKSLISSSNGSAISLPQSMLRTTTVNGYNSANSGAFASPASSHHSSASSSPSASHPNNNQHQVPSSIVSSSPNASNMNQRIQNSKNELRERLIQFCVQELVPVRAVSGPSFRSVLHAQHKFLVAQASNQFLQQPQLTNIYSTLTSCLNHLSLREIPDGEQLRTHLDQVYRQCRDKIRTDLGVNLRNNIGSALVCDSDQDACIMSVYYVDADWRLIEAILSASALVSDINDFVSRTLETFGLQERKTLNKFTFVSHGGLFGGVSVCLISMAHIVDKVVNETLVTLDEIFQSQNSLIFGDVFEQCQELVLRLNLKQTTSRISILADVDWVAKFEAMKVVLENRDQIESLYNDSKLATDETTTTTSTQNLVNFELLQVLVKLLEPFRTASYELRQCFDHPTLCHVLLYFHRLKKVLSSNLSYHHSTAKLSDCQTVKKNGHAKDMKVESKTVNGLRDQSSCLNESNDDDDENDEEEQEEMDEVKEETNIDSDDSTEEKDIGEKVESKKKINDLNNNNDEEEDGDDQEEEEEDNLVQKENCDQNLYENDGTKIEKLVENFKQLLIENLERYYEVKSLHRIATFLWPNFRLLKMLSPEEQKEVHEDVRKLIANRLALNEESEDSNFPDSSKSSGEKITENGNHSNSNEAKSKTSSDFDEWEVLSDQDQDEVDKYLSIQLTSCSEHFVLQWWREHSTEFPNLSKLAKWILSIPASVTTRERFKISNQRMVDDKLFFLNCNMQTEKFDLYQTTMKNQKNHQTTKSSSSSKLLKHINSSSKKIINNSNTSSSSLIAN